MSRCSEDVPVGVVASSNASVRSTPPGEASRLARAPLRAISRMPARAARASRVSSVIRLSARATRRRCRRTARRASASPTARRECRRARSVDLCVRELRAQTFHALGLAAVELAELDERDSADVLHVAGADYEAEPAAHAACDVLARRGVAASRSGVSTPFWNGTTTCRGRAAASVAAATSATCQVFTPSSTASTGLCLRSTCSLFRPGFTSMSPNTLSTLKPFVRIASRCAPRATIETSLPTCASRAPK